MVNTPFGEPVSTGIEGLDKILAGGLIPNRAYMIRGQPGSGKTIVGLHFLKAGIETGESSLFVAFEESERQIRENAAALALDVEEMEVLDLSPESTFFAEEQSYEIFTPEEEERGPLNETITERIEDLDPDRVVLDPVTQMRYLVPDDYQFRKQILSFIKYMKERGATILFTSQASSTTSDDGLDFLSDGVVNLDASGDYRTVRVTKFRGSSFQSGVHGMRIDQGGISVFPELVPGRHEREVSFETMSSGVPELDELLNGGVERGTISIFSGSTGVGKTTLGTQFMKEAAGRGERSVIYLFEESKRTLMQRAESINIPVADMLDRGTLSIEEVEPLQQSAQEFAHRVRSQVEERESSIVMIDGIDGYRLSLRGTDADLTRKLYSLCRYLKNMGVTVLLIDEVKSVTGEFEATSEKISYLADNIVFIRYLEVAGELRKAVGVLKKRTSSFESTLREFEIAQHGLKVGDPLTDLRGILRGDPEWTTRDRPDEQGAG